jgi:hypothetical protein
MPRRPRVFIGSSSAALEYAEALNARLDEKCEPTLWNHGVFQPGVATLEALVRKAHEVDFAALVLTPDDLVVKAGETSAAARDNVLFEAGLFMGTLGPERTFLVRSRDRPIALPSDLAGITQAFWNDRRDLNWDAALSVPARQILQAMERVREDAASTETVFDGRGQFDLGAWTVDRWEGADGDAVPSADVLGIERTNTSGRFVLDLNAVVARPRGGERVTLEVAGQARVQGGDHTFVLVFKEVDSPVGDHVWDARRRVSHGGWQAIDDEQEVVLHRDCRVRIEDRSVSSAPSRLELRELVITVRRFGFDIDL